jgi:hypothetical protein
MRHSLRYSIAALLLAAAAACSSSSEQPTVNSDLERDLAKAGGADVQLAGSSGNRIDVVSAAERAEGTTPAPKGTFSARTAAKERGKRAVTPTKRGRTPVTAPSTKSTVVDVVETPATEMQRTPTPAPQGRPEAPMPSRQPEPAGGWKTPGEIIRNAPFPINP